MDLNLYLIFVLYCIRPKNRRRFSSWKFVTGELVKDFIHPAYNLYHQITNTLSDLVQNSTMLESNVVSVERIVEYSRLPQEVSQ